VLDIFFAFDRFAFLSNKHERLISLAGRSVNTKIYFQALHWIFSSSESIISIGYNLDFAIFALFDHVFVELGLTHKG
jgi:hypothetical protein